LLACAATVFLLLVPAAFAEDNLPPGVAVPEWAQHKRVRFYPAPNQRKAVLEAHEHETAPMLTAQIPGGAFCFNGAKLCYWGGPIQHEPQIYLIFWGDKFQQGPPATLERSALLDIYESLEANKGREGQKHWQYILSQYFDNEGPGDLTAKVRVIFEKPTIPGELTNEQVEEAIEEFVVQESEKGNPPSPENEYIVIPQPGTNYSKYTQMKENCGFHGILTRGPAIENLSYTLVPWAEDTGCVGSSGNESALDETEGTATHEFAESATDPGVTEEGANKRYTTSTGWAKELKGEVEIADLCENEPHSTQQPLNDNWFAVLLWDDHATTKTQAGECRIEDPPYPAPVAPSATTGAAANIEENTANLEGTVNPNGPDTHYYFEYGTTTGYGSNSPAPPGNNAGFGESTVPASTVLSGLTPNTLYHYRLVAQSWVGTTKGEDKTFRTRAWKIQTTQNPHGSSETDEFRGVSCWAATGCDAVGMNTNPEDEIIGLVERWNGSGWAVQSTPKSTGAKEDNLESVACRSASECEATGYAEVAEGKHVTLAERWNGTAWSVQSTPTKGNDSNLVSVSCASASECVASGFYLSSAGKQAALVELWNGKEWKILTTATLPKEDEQSWLESISCPSSKHCTAVGAVVTTLNGIVPLAESYNGTTWTVQTTPTPEHSIEAQLSSVSCSATNACTAVGGYDNTAEKGERALIERYNGTSWALQEAASPVGKPAPKESHWALTAVSCPTSGSCVTVGSYAESAAGRKLLLGEQWNGTSWELALPVDRTAALYDEARGVSCSAALTCTLAGLSWKENNHSLTETLAERMEP